MKFIQESVMTVLFLTFGLIILMPSLSWACACGCGIFDVGTSSMFPSGQGGTIFEEYDFMDQKQNWSKSSKASADDNADKEIKTSFINTGFQYMFDRSWGVQVELPYDLRKFKTDVGDPGAPDIQTFKNNATGDLRIKGIYTGFSSDMSTGLTFGLKIPTGDWQDSNFDRDTEIGSGSTDLLLGAYYRANIFSESNFSYFIQDNLDQPFLTQGGYLPGTENDAAVGVYYSGFSVANVKITPVGEVLNSFRSRDRGWAAAPSDSGYERILLSPGIEFDYKKIMVSFDVGLPVYQYVNGNQLVSKALYKLTVSYKF